MAGSWLIASVWTDLIRASSSTTFAVHGISSLAQVPLRPCRLNLYLLGATGNRPWPLVMVVSRGPAPLEFVQEYPEPIEGRSIVAGLGDDDIFPGLLAQPEPGVDPFAEVTEKRFPVATATFPADQFVDGLLVATQEKGESRQRRRSNVHA